MPQKNHSLTEGSIWRSMLLFSFPVLLSNALQLFYDTFDAWTVGFFLGDKALAAVGSSSSLIFLLVGFFNGLSMGAGVVIARYYGARNYEAMKKAVHTNVAFGLAAGVLLTVLGVVFTPTILRWMGTPEDVLPLSIQYFRFYFCGALFVVMYNIFVGIHHAVGDSRHPLYFLLFSTCANVVLDLLFVGVFRWGVGSAALATTISQGISALLCCLHLLRTKEVYRLMPDQVRINLDSLLDIIRFGLPSGVQNSMISVANVFVQSSINSFGSAAMAGCGTYSKLEGFAFLPVVCFSQALSTFVGQNLGARQYERAKKGVAFGILCCVTMAETFGVLAYLFAPQLISLFNNTPAVVEFGSQHMRTICLFYFLLSFSHCMAAVFRGAGKAYVPMYTMLLFWCFVRIGYISLILPHWNTLATVSWAYPITWACSSIVFLIYYNRSNWIYTFDKLDTKNAAH